jgi:hypothetical protein
VENPLKLLFWCTEWAKMVMQPLEIFNTEALLEIHSPIMNHKSKRSKNQRKEVQIETKNIHLLIL